MAVLKLLLEVAIIHVEAQNRKPLHPRARCDNKLANEALKGQQKSESHCCICRYCITKVFTDNILKRKTTGKRITLLRMNMGVGLSLVERFFFPKVD